MAPAFVTQFYLCYNWGWFNKKKKQLELKSLHQSWCAGVLLGIKSELKTLQISAHKGLNNRFNTSKSNILSKTTLLRIFNVHLEKGILYSFGKKHYITSTKRRQNAPASSENVLFLFIIHTFAFHRTSNKQTVVFLFFFFLAHISTPFQSRGKSKRGELHSKSAIMFLCLQRMEWERG